MKCITKKMYKIIFLLIFGITKITNACYKWNDNEAWLPYKLDIYHKCVKICNENHKRAIFLLTHHTGWCYYCDCAKDMWYNFNDRDPRVLHSSNSLDNNMGVTQGVSKLSLIHI